MPLKAIAFNSTLKSSKAQEKSSTDRMLQLIADELGKFDVETEIIRLADYDIKPGVTSDEGEGDEWPGLRKKVLDAQILILGTPIWLGQPSSIAKRVLERMDAFLEETDEQGRMVSYGIVAGVAVVGNEDGAPCLRRGLPGAERRRLHHSGKRCRLLGGRSNGLDELR